MTIRIALVGDEQDHPSHLELNALRPRLGPDVETTWVATDGSAIRDLSSFDAVWIVPGSPYADDGAVIAAMQWAREANRPLLGTCGGLQYGVIEFARHVLGRSDAGHEEVDRDSTDPVVVGLACSLLGESRQVRPVLGTRFAGFVNQEPFDGMHFCAYAPSAAIVEKLVAAGMVVGATAEDAGVEVLELPSHRFYFLTLFQPHVGTIGGMPVHPLIAAFVAAARERPQ